MMGRRERGQGQFFYAFDLDAVVPADHPARKIEAVLDLSWVHGELERYYSHTGRPSIDPELMIRMLIVGYVFAIRSERRLCEEVQVNLAYRWFCGLGIEDPIPNHSVFSRARGERFREGDVLRRVFERVVARSIEAGLVGGEAFSIDASLIRADVDKTKRVPGRVSAKAKDAAGAYLAALDADGADKDDPGDADDQGDGAPAAAKPAKQISPSDPEATWVARPQIEPFFAYHANYLIDNKRGIIVDAEGSRADRSAEHEMIRPMIDRAGKRHGLRPQRLAGDTAYGTAPILKWLMDRGIEPHVPVWDKSKRTDGTFSRADFTYNAEHDTYTCPGGKALKTTGRVHDGRTLYYRSRKADCDTCPLKPRCCPKTPSRRIPRDIDEDVRDHVRALAGTEAFERSRRERKKVEMSFAHLKRILKLDRLRLRGLAGARDEILLAATAQNLRKLVKYAGPAPPNVALGCASS